MRTSAPRARPSYSCILCRQRRVKCDRAKPACGNCVKSKQTCLWHPSSGVTNAPIAEVLPQPQTNTLKRVRTDGVDPYGQQTSTFQFQAGLAHNGMVNNIPVNTPPSLGPASIQPHQTNSPVDIHEVAARLNQLTEVLGRLGYGPTEDAGALKGNSGAHNPKEQQLLRDIGNEVRDLNNVLLSAQKVGGNPPSSRPSLFLENAQNAADTLRRTHANQPLPKYMDDAGTPSGMDFTNDFLDSEGMKRLSREIPNRFQSELLWNNFIESALITFPIFHVPDLKRYYQRFWDLREDKTHTRMPIVEDCPDFFILLLAALSVGARIVPNADLEEVFSKRVRRVDLADRLSFALRTALNEVNYKQQPTAMAIAAQFFAFKYGDELEPVAEGTIIRDLVQAAQRIGLHRVNRNLPLIQQEVYRRLWWTLYAVDTQSSILNGTALVATNDDVYDHSFPSTLRDEYLHERDNSDVVADITNHDPIKIVLQSFFECAQTMRQVIRTLQVVTRYDLKDIERLGLIVYDYRRLCNKHIAEVKAIAEKWNGETDRRNARWAEVTLSSYSDKSMTTLYQPFLKGSKCALWPYSRTCALRSSHSLMRKVIYIATTPELEPIFRGHRRLHLPLQAVMISLIDSYERPGSEQSTASRVLVDKIFELVLECEDSFQKLAYRWGLLRKLRRVAYAKANIGVEDPNWQAFSRSMLKKVCDDIDAGVDPMYSCPADISLAEDTVRENVLHVSRDNDSGQGSPNTSTPSSSRSEATSKDSGFNYTPDVADDQGNFYNMDTGNSTSPSVPHDIDATKLYEQALQMPDCFLQTAQPMNAFPYNYDMNAGFTADVWTDLDWDTAFGNFFNVEIDESYLKQSDFYQGKIVI